MEELVLTTWYMCHRCSRAFKSVEALFSHQDSHSRPPLRLASSPKAGSTPVPAPPNRSRRQPLGSNLSVLVPAPQAHENIVSLNEDVDPEAPDFNGQHDPISSFKRASVSPSTIPEEVEGAEPKNVDDFLKGAHSKDGYSFLKKRGPGRPKSIPRVRNKSVLMRASITGPKSMSPDISTNQNDNVENELAVDYSNSPPNQMFSLSTISPQFKRRLRTSLCKLPSVPASDSLSCLDDKIEMETPVSSKTKNKTISEEGRKQKQNKKARLTAPTTVQESQKQVEPHPPIKLTSKERANAFQVLFLSSLKNKTSSGSCSPNLNSSKIKMHSTRLRPKSKQTVSCDSTVTSSEEKQQSIETLFPCSHCHRDLKSADMLKLHLKLHKAIHIKSNAKVRRPTKQLEIECDLCGRTLTSPPYKCIGCPSAKIQIDIPSMLTIKVEREEADLITDLDPHEFIPVEDSSENFQNGKTASSSTDILGDENNENNKANYVDSEEERAKILEKQFPFSCDICGKCYAIEDRLIVHVKGHSEKKRFNCDECGKSYRFRHHLTAHTQRNHAS